MLVEKDLRIKELMTSLNQSEKSRADLDKNHHRWRKAIEQELHTEIVELHDKLKQVKDEGSKVKNQFETQLKQE